MDLFERLLGHDQWTTARYLDMSRSLTDEQLDQEFDIGHRTIRKTFDHMILNVDFWTGQMVGQKVDYSEDRGELTISALEERHKRSYAWFESTSKKVIEENRLDETFVDHYDVSQSNGATILHVILHNQGHRGEVLHMFTRLNVPDLPEGDPQEWEHLTGIL
jgi:uncharacterized damage-inducible protein DinB